MMNQPTNQRFSEPDFQIEVLDTVQPQYDEPPVGSVWQDCRKMNWEGNKMGKYIRDLILKIIITFNFLFHKTLLMVRCIEIDCGFPRVK